MKTGDLVLFRGRGFIAWAIRAWTRSPWAHAGVLWVVEGVPLVIEARFADGVTCHALANRVDDLPEVFPTGRPLNLSLGLVHLGDWYSVKDALRAALDEPRNDNPAGWECAELAAALLGLDRLARGWTPAALAELFGA